MDKGTIEATKNLQVADLKELASVKGPCLTITVPIQPAENTSRMDYQRLKSAAQSAEPILAAHGLSPRDIREFLNPMTQIDGDSWGTGYGSLVVFRSPDVFRYFPVRTELKDAAIVADHFQVLPFLPALQNEQKHFFIMALSQHHVRLLRCTDHSSEDVPLGPGTPTSVEQWLNTRTPTSSPEHGTTRDSDAGPGGNFNGSTDMDNLDRHIRNFFIRVQEAVFDVLRGETAPMVIAGVEYEASLWRSTNKYPHVAEGHVQGSPDGLRGGELHARALEVAKLAFEAPMKKALEMYEKLGGSERVSTKPAEIVKAAHEARIAHLFVAEGASHPGGWHRETMQVTSEGAGEDFFNIAALHAIANGGEVWVTTPEKIPGGGPAAALFRF
jgi:hypothetical protein